MLLRETTHYLATTAKHGVRITAKDDDSMPRTRVVTEQTWQILQTMNDESFDGSCVLELGIGTYRR